MSKFLGELVDIQGGGTPARGNSAFWEGQIPWATVKDFKSTTISDTVEYITEQGVAESATNVISAGNIIVPTRMALGKAAINIVDLAINQDLKALIIKDRNQVDRDYLFRFLLSKSSFIESLGKGATVKGIRLEVLRELEIPLPPLAQQEHIAAILDKADTIRRKRQQAIKLADDFLRATFLDMFGDPVNNPKGWKMRILGELTKIQIGPFGTQLHKEDYVKGGIPLINPSHIVNGKIIPNDKLTITKQKHIDLPQYHLRFGDIIMGRRGEMGRCAIVSGQENGWLCGTGSLFLRFDQHLITPQYLYTLLSGKTIKTYLERESLGATLPNLNKGIVSKIKVPLPKFKYQEKYSQIVEQFQKITLSMSENNNLFSSLSQRAFRGEL